MNNGKAREWKKETEEEEDEEEEEGFKTRY